MTGVDTNILVRYFVQDDPEQAAAAAAFLESECTATQPGWINRIVLCELVWVLERAYRSPREEIADIVQTLAQTAEFELEDLDSVWRALGIYRNQGVDFADALLAATNAVRGCDATVMFDRKAARIAGMRLLETRVL